MSKLESKKMMTGLTAKIIKDVIMDLVFYPITALLWIKAIIDILS